MIGGSVLGVEGAGTSTSGVGGWTSGGAVVGSGGGDCGGVSGGEGVAGGGVAKIFLLQQHERAAELRGSRWRDLPRRPSLL